MGWKRVHLFKKFTKTTGKGDIVRLWRGRVRELPGFYISEVQLKWFLSLQGGGFLEAFMLGMNLGGGGCLPVAWRQLQGKKDRYRYCWRFLPTGEWLYQDTKYSIHTRASTGHLISLLSHLVFNDPVVYLISSPINHLISMHQQATSILTSTVSPMRQFYLQ